MTLAQVEPAPSYDNFDLINNLSSLYEMSKRGKQPLQSDWMRNYRLANNRIYVNDLGINGMPEIMDSEIFPVISSRIAWMTDQKVVPDVMAAAPTGTPWSNHMAHLSNHLQSILNTLYKVNRWEREIVKALWDSACFGVGIMKAEWDSGLDNGEGNVAIRRVDPWAFYVDPDATCMEDAEYIFEVHKMSYSEIERRFPATSQQLISDAVIHGDPVGNDVVRPRPGYANPNLPMAWPAVLPGSSGNQGGGTYGLEGQGIGVHTDQVLTQPVAVYECWIRENYKFTRETTDASLIDEEQVVTDSWRVVVYTGRTVLLDELAENLFQESRHPYVRFADEETGDFWQTPLVSHLAPCQLAINRLLGAAQGNTELTGNPVFMAPTNSGINRSSITNAPGVRLDITPAAANANNKPGWLNPPQIPSVLMALVQFWITRMENISGLSGPQKGNAPSGRQAQQTQQAAQEAGFVRIRSALRNLEGALAGLFQLCANLVVQNYTIPRVIAIIGEDGSSTALRLAARHFYMPAREPNGQMTTVPMKFTLIVSAGSSAPTSRQARVAEVDALFAMKAVDQQTVLEVHQFPNYQQILQRMAAAAQQQMQFQLALKGGDRGQPRGPGTGHEH
jgi:hypothetical protein